MRINLFESEIATIKQQVKNQQYKECEDPSLLKQKGILNINNYLDTNMVFI